MMKIDKIRRAEAGLAQHPKDLRGVRGNLENMMFVSRKQEQGEVQSKDGESNKTGAKTCSETSGNNTSADFVA